MPYDLPIMRIAGLQLRSILRWRAFAAILLLAAATGCRDLLVQPAPGMASLNLAVAPAEIAADGVTDAFDRADNIRVRILRDGHPTIEEVFPFTPTEETRISIRVELADEEESALLLVALRRGSDVLFRAERSIVLRSGTSPTIDLEILPVASRIEIAGSPTILRPEIGDTIQLRAAVLLATGDTLATAPIEWSTTNADVARVDQTGRVTIVGYGDAEVRATSGTLSAGVDVEVRQRVGAVLVAPSRVELAVDSAAQLTATVYDTRGNVIAGRGVTWSSSGPEVAVSAIGRVTALAPGEVTITAAIDDVSGSATVVVREEESEPEPEPEPNPFLGYWAYGSFNSEDNWVQGDISELTLFEVEGMIRGSMQVYTYQWTSGFVEVPLYNVRIEGDTLMFSAMLPNVEIQLVYDFAMTMDPFGNMDGTGNQCLTYFESPSSFCEPFSVFIVRGSSMNVFQEPPITSTVGTGPMWMPDDSAGPRRN
jgi:hypothetical protein